MDSKKLAAAIREMKINVGVIMGADVPEIEAVRDDLCDVKDLLGVLAHIVDGKPVDKAFGSPGDWGYSTPIGSALAASAPPSEPLGNPCPSCNPTGVFKYGDDRCDICHGKAFMPANVVTV